MSWTTSDELRDQVLRLWTRGRILAAATTGEALFPLKLSMRRPEAKAIGASFEAVRIWIRDLEENSRACKGFGYDIEWTEINHRQLGRNKIPTKVSIPTEADALRLIGKEKDARQSRELSAATTAKFPALRGWIARRPFVLLDHARDWSRILDVLAWFRDHPQSNLYLRQVDIPGVDTKFVEGRRQLFSDLLDIVLDRQGATQVGSIAQVFEEKYGLRSKPPLIRFRILDSRIAFNGLCDISIPATDFALLKIAARHVFITENDVNGLAFPDVADAIVVFGLGYSVDLLNAASWRSDRTIHYWGDIDTHGFAILDRLRVRFPYARSLLMNREILMEHRPLWVREDTPHRGTLSRLDPNEQSLFDDLACDRLGERVRLEQERVSYAALKNVMRTAGVMLRST